MVLVEKVVAICCRHARAVVTAGIVVAAAGFLFASTHFAMNTDSSRLISANLPWRKTMDRYDKLFPQRNNLILVVIDGATAERANAAANKLAAALTANPAMFPAVRRPDGGPFFERNGLLFMSEPCVQDMMDAIVKAQPFLGALAADPSLRGVMESLTTVMQGVESGGAKLSDVDAPISAFGQTLATVNRGQMAFLSWRSLFTGGGVGGQSCQTARLRTFIEVQPKLDYGALEPGEIAEQAIRDAAQKLDMTPDKGIRVRLTGPVPLSDEEFATLAERAEFMGLAMLLAVTLCLWFAVGSVRLIFCILSTLFAGLVTTTALGLLFIQVFNIISIAFIALFVGLGVDFAIQFSVRYRHERHTVGDLAPALIRAGRSLGIPLALAAGATAVGFFSFLPTDYVGVAELGLIAGMGMVIAYLFSITFLPALIKLVRPPGEAEHVGFAGLAPVDRFLETHRRQVLIWGAVAAVLSLATLPFLKFDFNPFDLRNRKVESMATLMDLMADPDTSPNTIDVLAPSLREADKLARKLEARPLVGQVLTLSSFVPEDQPKKLALISDAAFLLDATLNPFDVKAPPTDQETVASIKAAAVALRRAVKKQAGQSAPEEKRAAGEALRLARQLELLAGGSAPGRELAANALIPGLEALLDELRSALQASEVSIKSMPPDLVSDWIAKDGTARIQVFPKINVNDNESLKRFSRDVQAVTPYATGTPITIEESGNTIVRAFIEAGLWSFIAITILLMIVLRRERDPFKFIVTASVISLVLAVVFLIAGWPLSFVRIVPCGLFAAVVLRREHDVLMTIIPLMLTAVLTLATCWIAGLQLNFANIIALPLLFGIGVAFDIYFVVAWRAGAKNLLQSSLTRAVIFSAATTASGFGSLVLSSHPGTSSMGKLLVISLAWTLFATLFFLPALLGPPPTKASK